MWDIILLLSLYSKNLYENKIETVNYIFKLTCTCTQFTQCIITRGSKEIIISVIKRGCFNFLVEVEIFLNRIQKDGEVPCKINFSSINHRFTSEKAFYCVFANTFYD